MVSTLPSLEDLQLQNMSPTPVDIRWKAGSLFRHVVIHKWIKIPGTDNEGKSIMKVLALVSLVQKNLLLAFDSNKLLVCAREFFDKWVVHRMYARSQSKLFVDEGIYMSAN